MTFALVAVHIAMQTAWLSVWTMLVSTAHRGLSAARVRRSLEALAGLPWSASECGQRCSGLRVEHALRPQLL
jgi:hypothetical protein